MKPKVKKLFGVTTIAVISLITLLNTPKSNLANLNTDVNQFIRDYTSDYQPTNIKDLPNKDLAISSFKEIAKSKTITIIKLVFKDNDKPQYYVLNNHTGNYFLQKEMTDWGLNFKNIGFDRENNVFHFRSEGGDSHNNYWYLIDKNQFIENENNFRYYDNITFSIRHKSGWTNHFYLESHHSSDKNDEHKSSQEIESQFWDIGKNPTLQSENYLSKGDNIFKVSGMCDKKHSFSWFFDAETNKFISTNEINNNLMQIKGNYFFYDDYFTYGKRDEHNQPSEHINFKYLYNYSKTDDFSWRETIDDKSVFIDQEGYYEFVDFQNFNHEPKIIPTKIKSFNQKNSLSQSDDGNFYLLCEEKQLLKFEFENDNHVDALNLNTSEILTANEEFFASISTQDKLIIGSKFFQYGVKINQTSPLSVNFFIDKDVFFLNSKNFILDIQNQDINVVKLNNELLLPLEVDNHHWQVNLASDEFKEENNFTLSLKTIYKKTVTFDFSIIESYLPEIEMEETPTENKVDRFVYEDETDGLVDGYYSKYESTIKIDDPLIEEVFINDSPIDQNDEYKLDELGRKNYLTIIDKFGKSWEEKIYINYDVKKYWYETDRGKENFSKMEKLGYSEKTIKSLTASETAETILKLDDVFDLDTIIVYDRKWNDTIDEVERDILEWYGSRIPINRITLSYQKNKDGIKQDKTLKEIINDSFIKRFNKNYSLNLNYNDFTLEFLTGDDLVHKDNAGVTTRGTSTHKVVGSIEWGWSAYTLEWVDLRELVDWIYNYKEPLQENIDSYMNTLSDHQKDTFKFKDIEENLNTIVVSSLNDYVRTEEYSQYSNRDFDNKMATIRSDELKIEWVYIPFNSNDIKEIDPNIFIKDIKVMELKLTSVPNSLVTEQMQMSNIENTVYGFHIDHHDEDDDEKGSWMGLWITLGLIGIIILFFKIFLLIKRSKQKREYNNSIIH